MRNFQVIIKEEEQRKIKITKEVAVATMMKNTINRNNFIVSRFAMTIIKNHKN
jgi:hypothetical protein